MSRNKPARLFALVLGLTLCVACVPGALAFRTSRRAAARGGAGATAIARASIIGGAPAADGSFLSLAYILDLQGRFVYQCTGTVVAPNLILTAGHCAENARTGVVNQASGYRVATGTVDPMTSQPTVSTVLGVIVYPGLARRTDDGDAALLVLATPTAAPPITLASGSQAAHLRAGASAVIVGWGLTSLTQRLPTERLQSATTVVQRRTWCKTNAPPFYAKSELCTITPPSYATGVCAGDSGGPLLVQSPATGEPVEVGIAVHVYGRCSTRHPSVFASVGPLSSWIHSWVEAYKQSPSPPTTTPAPALPAPGTPSAPS